MMMVSLGTFLTAFSVSVPGEIITGTLLHLSVLEWRYVCLRFETAFLCSVCRTAASWRDCLCGRITWINVSRAWRTAWSASRSSTVPTIHFLRKRVIPVKRSSTRHVWWVFIHIESFLPQSKHKQSAVNKQLSGEIEIVLCVCVCAWSALYPGYLFRCLVLFGIIVI